LAAQSLSARDGWQKRSLIIDGVRPGEDIEIAFYSTPLSSAGSAEDLYGDLSVSQLSRAVAPSRTLVSHDMVQSDRFSMIRLSSNEAEISVKGRTVLATDTAYDPGWNLDVQTLNHSKAPKIARIEVNGYATGWLISGSGKYVVTPVFLPSRLIHISLLLSLSIVCLATFSIILRPFERWASLTRRTRRS
jgi:hypothetical protein